MLLTKAFATSTAGLPRLGSIFNALKVSVTQGGETTLMRMPRGASSAAARVNPSNPALTRLIAALPTVGWWERMPLVSVIEPLSCRIGSL